MPRDRRTRNRRRAEHRVRRAAELSLVRGLGVLIAYWWTLSNDPEGALELLLSARYFWTPQQRAILGKALALERQAVFIPTPPLLFAANRWYCGLGLPKNEDDLLAGPDLIEKG